MEQTRGLEVLATGWEAEQGLRTLFVFSLHHSQCSFTGTGEIRRVIALPGVSAEWHWKYIPGTEAWEAIRSTHVPDDFLGGDGSSNSSSSGESICGRGQALTSAQRLYVTLLPDLLKPRQEEKSVCFDDFNGDLTIEEKPIRGVLLPVEEMHIVPGKVLSRYSWIRVVLL